MHIASEMPAEDQATARYARCIEASKRVSWDIDADIIRGRSFDLNQKYLPDGLSLVQELPFLSTAEKRTLSQVQGRTYANMFGLVERFINAKILEISRDHCFGDQTALLALIRFSEEELKHQDLFRRIERMIASVMPPGYVGTPDPNAVAAAVLSKSTWAVLALTLHIELFSQAHYRESIDNDPALSPLFKDIFLYHWKEESQHAIMDELEWKRENAKLTAEQRDKGVTEFIELVGAIDGMLQAQAKADAGYFIAICGRPLETYEMTEVNRVMLKAYRWQYILFGANHPHFVKTLTGMITPEQTQRVLAALATLQ
jgi:hypothetical protein